ncbi:M18 family aminopeptidase [Methylomonas sp. SURF-2]|uniref:M18 family aminopeptidase n=1 Tax=Methylomonas subterranea TaxID=2952225 RepID=A0ABT1TMQ7_9GAMM|nr:M18 family aminopeptidase [Methylomonas sp. SURF-2]MCQ8106382.1 M18 family aminopeptidase [Methylomonas sp. SURF-2]
MTARQQVRDCLDFIDASPSPWHVVATLEQRLRAFGFKRLDEADAWSLSAGERYYVVRDESSIVIFVTGQKDLPATGFKILGAHTDSPGLRLKPNPAGNSDKLLRLAVEVYGGPILATFSDRDLSLAGRIAYRGENGKIASRLVSFDQPLLRLPNLAIHMNRSVNEDGLKLNKQTELPLIFAEATDQQLAREQFTSFLTTTSGLEAEQILAWEFNIHDTQKGAFWGADQAFYANSQLDNLASCHAGISALLNDAALQSGNTLVCAFFDHEEIGSESSKGAAGSFLPDVLERIALAQGLDKQDYQRALANSLMISADMAHAYQPNFPGAYEPDHKLYVNQGPAIKINANHRYASNCLSEAAFMELCRQAEVPFQKYSHRGDLPCGSTIGPLASAKLGIPTVDVGNPMWAMHSVRESAGVLDHAYLIKALTRLFAGV